MIISVVILSYDYTHFVGQAVQSIKGQSFKDAVLANDLV